MISNPTEFPTIISLKNIKFKIINKQLKFFADIMRREDLENLILTCHAEVNKRNRETTVNNLLNKLKEERTTTNWNAKLSKDIYAKEIYSVMITYVSKGHGK